VSRGALHRQLILDAAERFGFEVLKEGARDWVLVDPETGKYVWRVRFLMSGYFGGAFGKGANYVPDYRTHAMRNTPREVLDSWIARLNADATIEAKREARA